MADHGYGEVAYQIGHEQEAVLQDSDHMQGFPLRVPIDLSGQLTYTLPDLFLGEDNAQVIPVGSHPGLGGGCFGSELGVRDFLTARRWSFFISTRILIFRNWFCPPGSKLDSRPLKPPGRLPEGNP